jgi:hypothetical protein
MRYRVQDIEDQILETVRADSTNFSGLKMVNTYAGQISAQNFLDPSYEQGFVNLLPFCLVSYQGRVSQKSDRDSSGLTYIHTLTFRIYVGATSLRMYQDAVRNCYDMLAALYDDLHGKVPKSTPQCLPAYTTLDGTAITTSEFTAISPLYESGGTDERLVVNLPRIVVYQSDYSIRLVA